MPFVFTQNVLYASILVMVSSPCISFYFLRKQGAGLIESFGISVAAMVSGIWLYEIFYHFSYPDTLTIKNITGSILTLNFNTTNSVYPLTWSIIMTILPLSGIKYMKINYVFIGVLIFSIVSFYFWISVGFPQFFSPEWWPCSTPYINLIPLDLAHTASPIITFWGGLINSITKILVTLPALLFIKNTSSNKLKSKA